jgi:protoporphyrin/coproporphyrin ferrochelatase
MMSDSYDALLIVSFGGPERREDVLPFLENVVRGRRIPRERLLEVAEHYYHFGGVSPINSQVRGLIVALEHEMHAVGVRLPIYWGNRNWDPLLPDTLRQMADDGVRRALAWVTSAYSSYSGCRQYRENIEAARAEVGPRAPQVDKVRVFYNHPAFVEAQADRVSDALGRVPPSVREQTCLLYAAHSLPAAMAEGCQYVQQLEETWRLVSERVGHRHSRLVYQSRSGPPNQPWLEPDICDAIEQLHARQSVSSLVVVPIGFLSDHVEVLYDLDVEARQTAERLGVGMVRAATVGTHHRFVQMIRDLFLERLEPAAVRLAIGRYGPHHDICPADCCPSGMQRPSGSPARAE